MKDLKEIIIISNTIVNIKYVSYMFQKLIVMQIYLKKYKINNYSEIINHRSTKHNFLCNFEENRLLV